MANPAQKPPATYQVPRQKRPLRRRVSEARGSPKATPTNSVRVRIAPSPTGPLHVGTVRAALFNWLFARQNGGVFVLRIEDTDRERSDKKYETEIFEGLKWLGLEWDEGPVASAPTENLKLKTKNHTGKFGPYRQSERTEIYKKYLEQLLAEEKAYYCYCTKEELEAERQSMMAQGLPAKYSGHCRSGAPERALPNRAGRKPQVIRFKTPETQVEFKDIIRGKITFDASLFGDLAIAKDLTTPLFNFAGAVDDQEMKISHVIRGEDHLSNTPKQILLQKALGFEEPEYAHLPLVLNPDRSKMSKRFADTAIAEYRERGYLPGALVNFLALLGWHSKTDKEVFTLSELVEEFDLKRAQKAGAIFNQEKLDWLQKEHFKNVSSAEMVKRFAPFLEEKNIKVKKEFLEKVILAERSRFKTLNDFWEIAGFFFELPDYKPELLVWQKEPATKIRAILEEVLGIIRTKSKTEFYRGSVAEALRVVIAREGRGAVLWPLRVALSGLAASPDPMEIIEVLGKEEAERRLEVAISKLQSPSGA